MNVDVVIAGGGPNGLLTACELALAGVRPLVLERLPEPPAQPRANGLVGRIVQALDHRGITQLFGGASPPRPIPRFQFGALHLDMAGLDGKTLYALPVPQRRMVELLTARAVELGAEIRHGHELTSFHQDADQVELAVCGPTGAYELTCRYLVAADGGHSPIRKASGIDFPGVTDTGFVGRSGQVTIDPPVAVPETGELDVPGVGRLRPSTFTRTETGMFAYGMFEPGIYRVTAYEWGTGTGEDRGDWSWTEIPTEELRAAVARVLGATVPMAALPGGPPARATSTSNSRQAERYRAGRVLLVGDAAHVHSGIGGPGLNLGLQDALNLGWKLAAQVQGWAPPGLLDSYEAERLPVGARVIMQTRAQTELLKPGPHVTALRQVLAELLEVPGNVRHISDLMSGADTRYDMGGKCAHPLVGRWMPDLPLATGDGRATRVAEVMRTARPVLLDLAGRADLAGAAEAWRERVDLLRATTAAPSADAVLVRPDGYVAWAGADPDGLADALRRWFGEPVRTR